MESKEVAGKFEIIAADPPWKYNSRRASASRFGGGAGFYYSLMEDADILALPVREIAADDAVLFLWATWPRLEFAFEVIRAWGFTYKTCAFDWFKLNPEGGFCFGVGTYSKSNSEPCLLATRGRTLWPDNHDVSMALAAAEALATVRGPHSRKPAEVYRRIDRMYPARRKLEMFARRERAGWVTWGNEITEIDLRQTVDLLPPSLTEQQAHTMPLFT